MFIPRVALRAQLLASAAFAVSGQRQCQLRVRRILPPQNSRHRLMRAALYLTRQQKHFCVAVSLANNRDVVRLLRSAGGEWNAGSRRYPVIIILKFQT